MNNLPGSKHFSITAYDSAAFTASEAKESDKRIFVTDISATAKEDTANFVLYETDSGGGDSTLYQAAFKNNEVGHSFNTPLIVSSDNYLKASVENTSSEARVNVSGFKA